MPPSKGRNVNVEFVSASEPLRPPKVDEMLLQTDLRPYKDAATVVHPGDVFNLTVVRGRNVPAGFLIALTVDTAPLDQPFPAAFRTRAVGDPVFYFRDPESGIPVGTPPVVTPDDPSLCARDRAARGGDAVRRYIASILARQPKRAYLAGSRPFSMMPQKPVTVAPFAFSGCEEHGDAGWPFSILRLRAVLVAVPCNTEWMSSPSLFCPDTFVVRDRGAPVRIPLPRCPFQRKRARDAESEIVEVVE